MSGPYTEALADLRRWRDHVEFLIASLEKLDSGAPLLGSLVASKATETAEGSGAASKATKPRVSTPAKASESKDGHDVLAAIRKAGGSISPGDLVMALRTNKYGLKARTAPLLASKQIVVTGVTAGRRFSLPGKQPAKEAH